MWRVRNWRPSVRALYVVQARYDLTRKARAAKVGAPAPLDGRLLIQHGVAKLMATPTERDYMPAFPIHPACSGVARDEDRRIARPRGRHTRARPTGSRYDQPGGRTARRPQQNGRVRDRRRGTQDFLLVTVTRWRSASVRTNIVAIVWTRSWIGLRGCGTFANLANGTNRHVAFADAKARIHVASEFGIATIETPLTTPRRSSTGGTPEVIALAKSKQYRSSARHAADYTRAYPQRISR